MKPLHFAIQNDNVEIVKALLSHKDINFTSNSEKNRFWENIYIKIFLNEDPPLLHAIKNNKAEIFKLFLDHKDFDINKQII